MVIWILVAFLIPDTMISYVSDFIYPGLVTFWGVTSFISIAGAFFVSQYFILDFIKNASKEIRSKDKQLYFIYKIVIIIQLTLSFIMVAVILQILTSSQYFTSLLILANSIIFLLTILLLALFSQKLFSWFLSNRNSLVVLLYGGSFILSVISFSVLLAYNLAILPGKQAVITPDYEVVFPGDVLEPGSLLVILLDAYSYIDMVAFSLMIAATALLLSHYSKRLGRAKFWIFISLPGVYFFSTFLDIFGLYIPSTDSDWFYWYLYNSLNSTAGGILFGIAFLTIAKTIRQDSPVKQYMMIAAFGFVLLFIANQVSLNATSYPPFGLATQSVLALSSYMILLGVYSTAVSVSQDNKLRSSIKRIAAQNVNLLGSIGTAQMEQEIQRTVNSMKDVVQEQEKELEEQTGIEANLGEDEMKSYLEQVMQEVGRAKKPET